MSADPHPPALGPEEVLRGLLTPHRIRSALSAGRPGVRTFGFMAAAAILVVLPPEAQSDPDLTALTFLRAVQFAGNAVPEAVLGAQQLAIVTAVHLHDTVIAPAGDAIRPHLPAVSAWIQAKRAAVGHMGEAAFDLARSVADHLVPKSAGDAAEKAIVAIAALKSFSEGIGMAVRTARSLARRVSDLLPSAPFPTLSSDKIVTPDPLDDAEGVPDWDALTGALAAPPPFSTFSSDTMDTPAPVFSSDLAVPDSLDGPDGDALAAPPPSPRRVRGLPLSPPPPRPRPVAHPSPQRLMLPSAPVPPRPRTAVSPPADAPQRLTDFLPPSPQSPPQRISDLDLPPPSPPQPDRIEVHHYPRPWG